MIRRKFQSPSSTSARVSCSPQEEVSSPLLPFLKPSRRPHIRSVSLSPISLRTCTYTRMCSRVRGIPSRTQRQRSRVLLQTSSPSALSDLCESKETYISLSSDMSLAAACVSEDVSLYACVSFWGPHTQPSRSSRRGRLSVPPLILRSLLRGDVDLSRCLLSLLLML